jgi:hypothetical protein
MKQYLPKLPTLTAPEPGESLTLYIATSDIAISAMLMVERNKAHVPVYFIGRTLNALKTRYAGVEKLTLALVFASRRLRRYF